MKRFVIALIRGYAAAVSPLLGPGKCRFHPVCSAYACQAVMHHGVVRGGWLAVRRIFSCHPYSRRPFLDPVPSSIKTPLNVTNTNREHN